jgi:hypothetical protein
MQLPDIARYLQAARKLQLKRYSSGRTQSRFRSVPVTFKVKFGGIEMRNDTGTEVGKQYTAAHATQYATKDLHEALELYRDIIGAHPNTQEAEYSRAQIQNIVNAVVPKQELFDAQVDLVLAHLEHGDQPNLKLAPVTPLASKLPH